MTSDEEEEEENKQAAPLAILETSSRPLVARTDNSDSEEEEEDNRRILDKLKELNQKRDMEQTEETVVQEQELISMPRDAEHSFGCEI